METNTVHQLIGKEKVSGSMRGYAFSGWDYDGGWLVGFSPLGGGPEKTVWADSKTVFYAFPNPSLAGQENIEISPEPIALTDEEKDAILGMAWQWEIWEPMSRDGMCMVQCLTKYLDLPEDDIVEMFRRAFRDPQRKEHVIEVLNQNGYKVHKLDRNGFSYRERRRLVTMNRIANPKEGHVVLVYESDEGIFDSSSKFKKVSDLMATSAWGWKLGDVLIIDKVEPGN